MKKLKLEQVEVLVDRCERWWMIDVPYHGETYYSQAKHFKNIELMVLDLLSMVTGRPESDFSIVVKGKNANIETVIEKTRALLGLDGRESEIL